jgi:4-hydroxy-tetrahydrodipicolinate synthase
MAGRFRGSAAGYPVGNVRAPLTGFKALGREGEKRMAKLTSIMDELDALMAGQDGPGLQAAA